MARMKTTNDLREAFTNYAVFDGPDQYIPRSQLMNALQMMGLNPTFTALEDVVPESGEDVRVSWEEFEVCYGKVKHTKAFDRKGLIEAFQVFDPENTGKLRNDEFLRAMNCGEDEMRTYEQQELLAQADPHNTGWVDYIAFANFLCPEKVEKRQRRARPVKEPEPEPEPVVVERDYDAEAREEALQTMVTTMLREAEEAERGRATEKKKLHTWINTLAAIKINEVSEESVRVNRDGDGDADNEERSRALKALRDELSSASQQLATYEEHYESLIDIMGRQRDDHDRTFLSLPPKYDAPAYDSIRALLHLLFQCRHRILTNSWTPIAESDRSVIEFLRGCGGDMGEFRGSTPSVEPAGSEEEMVAFKVGSYIHHGSSPTWEGGPICLLPPQVLNDHPKSAAARLLTVPCELEDLGHPIEDTSGEGKACRAAFYDGVNGRHCDTEELVGWAGDDEDVDPDALELKLKMFHQRGLWYSSEVSLEGRSNTAEPVDKGNPHYILGHKARLKSTLEDLQARVAAVQAQVDFLNQEEKAVDELDEEATVTMNDTEREWQAMIEAEGRKWKTELRELQDKEEEERRRREEEEAERKRREAEEEAARKKREAEEAERKRKEAEEAAKKKPTPPPKPREAPKKKGGGCC